MTVTAIAVALIVGFGMGMLGGGGSIVAVPALTFLLHFAPKEAVVTSLAVVGLAAAAGAAGSLARGVLPLAIALPVGVSATLGAFAGGTVGARLSDHVQMSILAAVMFGAAVLMWRPKGSDQSAQPRGTAFLIALGLAIGVLTGLVGVGGGFLIVPALVLGAGVPVQKAAAASLFVIMLSALSALTSYAGHASIRWSFVAPFAVVAGAAAIAGGMIAHRLPQQRLQRAFAVTLVILGSYVLFQA